MKSTNKNTSTTSKFPKHRIEQAREKLRKALSYERIIKQPKYKDLTRKQHFLLVKSIDTICLILLESYIGGANI
jgi:hypothetical protein